MLDHFASIPAAGGVDQPAVKAVLKMLDSGKVWLKLSGPMRCTDEPPPYPSVTPLAHVFVKHAPERMVWGSDWPHVNLDGMVMPNDGDLLDLLAEWVPDSGAQPHPDAESQGALRILRFNVRPAAPALARRAGARGATCRPSRMTEIAVAAPSPMRSRGFVAERPTQRMPRGGSFPFSRGSAAAQHQGHPALAATENA